MEGVEARKNLPHFDTVIVSNFNRFDDSGLFTAHIHLIGGLK